MFPSGDKEAVSLPRAKADSQDNLLVSFYGEKVSVQVELKMV